MKRRVPRLTTDEQAEAFLESDLSDLDFSQFKSGRLRMDETAIPAAKTRFSEDAQKARPASREPGSPARMATSETYRLFERAMANQKQIVCTYGGYRRELCAVILGHTDGKEMALTYQFAGGSRKKLPPEGAWRCLVLAGVSNAQLRDGPLRTGTSHTQTSHCVETVDLDVNPESPYNPKRRLDRVS